MGIFLIARDNIKKKKSNAAILFLLVTLATLLLYVGVSVLSNLNTVVDNRNAAVNGADYILITSSDYGDDIEKMLRDDKDTAYCERETIISVYGAKYYKDTQTIDDAQQIVFHLCDVNAARTLALPTEVDTANWRKDSIIVPYYLKAGLGYEVGDRINIVMDSVTHSFVINSFSEDVMFSTPTNITAEKCFISSERFKELDGSFGVTDTFFRVRLNSGSDDEAFELNMTKRLNSEIADYMYQRNTSLNYSVMRSGTGVSASIFMGVLTAFSMILILVSLVIVHFNVNNSIESNMKNIGILEASGYTGRQLRLATAVEFLGISVMGALFGLIAASLAITPIGTIVSSSVGLKWELAFDVKSAAISILTVLLLVFLATFVASRKYKKITVLDALREGMTSHNFKKNRIRLDKTRLPLNLAVAAKGIFFHKKKNITICAIVVLLAFCACEATNIYINMALNSANMIQVSGFETPDMVIDSKCTDGTKISAEVDAMLEKLATLPQTDYSLRRVNYEVSCRNGDVTQSANCDFYSDTDRLRTDTVVEGRRPKYDNEIMLSVSIADRLNAKVGDTIYVEFSGDPKDCVISGISQGIANLGKKAMMTEAGLNRLDSARVINFIYVYAKEGTDLEAYMSDIEALLDGHDIGLVNYQDYLELVMESIVSIMRLMCIVMLLAVVIVIALILTLLIKSQMVRDMKQFGISKALGYTTSQLIKQTALGYLPIIAVGCVIGSLISYFTKDLTFLICLSSMGIRKCSMGVSLPLVAVICLAICAWSFIISVLCAGGIRKIAPCRMLQEL